MSAPAFELPPALEAHEPPEARGLARDDVRLLVSRLEDGALLHARFRDLPRFLAPGDLVVVNTSATLPAALSGRLPGGKEVAVHLSTPAPDGDPDRMWVVELRRDGSPFSAAAGTVVALDGGGEVRLLAPYGGVRLWVAALDLPEPLGRYLAKHGRPITYPYVRGAWPLSSYQNVYATEPGSAEMASAGRPFTAELVTRLVAAGVLVAPITLHAGVSSPERRERPFAERYRVGEATARLVNAVRGWGGRVVATGTTVVRALDTVAAGDGTVVPGAGWTSLVVTPERGVRAVDGLITGLHEPAASHLDLLRAIAGDDLLARSYRAAVAGRYRWHEFGDSHLLLGPRRG